MWRTSLSSIRAAIQTLTGEIDVIDKSVGGQKAGIDEMAKASQALAMMPPSFPGRRGKCIRLPNNGTERAGYAGSFLLLGIKFSQAGHNLTR